MKLTNQGKVTPPIEIDYDDVKTCIGRLEAFTHPTRRRILTAIDKLDQNATTANIIEAISLEPRIVEKHLKILSKEKVIYSQKVIPPKLIYIINHNTISKAAWFVKELNKEE